MIETCHLTDEDRKKGYLCRLMDCPYCTSWRAELENRLKKKKLEDSMEKQEVNLNNLAGEIAKIEGGHQNLSIAQIKEVMKCYHKVLVPILKDNEKYDQWFKKVVEA